MINALFDSIQSLYERFNVNPDEVDSLRIFNEEQFEFTEALTTYKVNSYEPDEFYLRDSVLSEAADVLYTLLGALYANGFSFTELSEAVETIIEKNDAKSGLTHEYVDGKIRRIGK